MNTLLLMLALGQLAPEPDAPIRPRLYRSDGADRTSRLGQDDYAFFEFAPNSGAGAGSVCACTNPTGAKGEVATFTRASSATCTKTQSSTLGGLTTTGIANGDLVTCGNNLARMEYDAWGGIGYLYEPQRTNSVLRSSEFDNAVWVKNDGIAVTVTPNAAVAPDGTLTADRMRFSACALTTEQSVIRQEVVGVPNALSSVYAKSCVDGAADGGCLEVTSIGADGGAFLSDGGAAIGLDGGQGVAAISVCQYNNPGNACTACALNPLTWTRCAHKVGGASAPHMIIGCENVTASFPNGTNTGAADVYLWGAQHEAGTIHISSHIPTTSAAVTRPKDVLTFNASEAFPSWPISWAASITSDTIGAGKTGYFVVMSNSGSFYDISQSTGATTFTCSLGSTTAATKSSTVTYGNNFRAGCIATATTVDTTFNGVASGSPTTHALTPFTVTNGTIQIGDLPAFSPQQTGSIISRVCVGPPDPARCF